MARELGHRPVRDHRVQGAKGRITKDDLLGFLKGPAERRSRCGRRPPQGVGDPGDPGAGLLEVRPGRRRQELPRIKKVSGPFLHRSWLNVPHVTHNDEADITDLDAYRKQLDTAAKADKQPLPGHAAGVPGQGRGRRAEDSTRSSTAR